MTIVNFLKNMYEGSENCVSVGQDRTEWFRAESGVRQGDSLYPILFNIVIDYCIGKVDTISEGIQWTDKRRLRDLDYADDI